MDQNLALYNLLEHMAKTLDHIDQQFTKMMSTTDQAIEEAVQDFKKHMNISQKPKIPEGWGVVSIRVDKANNIAHVNAHEKDFDPKFLRYMLESQNINPNIKVVFDQD